VWPEPGCHCWLVAPLQVEGFFEDVLQREPVDSIRDNLRDLIARKMEMGD